jgi:hypothetical protein
MRHRLTLALALAAATLVAGEACAQGTGTSPTTAKTYNYTDAQGAGQLTIDDVGAASLPGGRAIRVALLQNDRRYLGSGTMHPSPQNSADMLLHFALVGPKGTVFVFHGVLRTSGTTVTAQGTYHRLGFPEQIATWRILSVAGGTGTGGGGAGGGATR